MEHRIPPFITPRKYASSYRNPKGTPDLHIGLRMVVRANRYCWNRGGRSAGCPARRSDHLVAAFASFAPIPLSGAGECSWVTPDRAGVRAEDWGEQAGVPEFCSEVAVPPLFYSRDRVWQVVRTAEESAPAARPPREVDLSRIELFGEK